jgi:hypothetical protein
MTLDELAAASQHEFESIRREMATKEDLRAVGASILRAIENVDRHLKSYASRRDDELGALDDHMQQIENRVAILEKPED